LNNCANLAHFSKRTSSYINNEALALTARATRAMQTRSQKTTREHRHDAMVLLCVRIVINMFVRAMKRSRSKRCAIDIQRSDD